MTCKAEMLTGTVHFGKYFKKEMFATPVIISVICIYKWHLLQLVHTEQLIFQISNVIHSEQTTYKWSTDWQSIHRD